MRPGAAAPGWACGFAWPATAEAAEPAPRAVEAPPDTLEGQARELIRGAYKLDGQQGQNTMVSLFDGYWDKQPGRPQAIVYGDLGRVA